MRSVNIQILFAACNSWRAQLKTPCLSLAGFLRSPLCVNSLGSQRPSQTPGLSTADTYHALTPPREETIVQASVPAPGTGRRERRLRRSREEGKKGRKTSFPSPEAPEVCPGIYFKPRPPAASGLVPPLQISKDTWSLPSAHVPFLLSLSLDLQSENRRLLLPANTNKAFLHPVLENPSDYLPFLPAPRPGTMSTFQVQAHFQRPSLGNPPRRVRSSSGAPPLPRSNI